jgi:hypothetical protein
MTTSHLYGDTLFQQLNNSVGKMGGQANTTGVMNITSLLKSNIMEEDGIEDMHFYLVTFNSHKNGILKGLEERKKLT